MKLYLCFPEGKAKALTMSYDDGKWADERLVELFNRHGIRGTFNLNYGLMERPERIDKDRIRQLYEGHEVATHTMTHPTIARCPLTETAKRFHLSESRAKKTEAQALDNVWLELPWWYEQHRTFLLASIIEAWIAVSKMIDAMMDE